MEWQKLRQRLFERTRQRLRESFSRDELIISTIRLIDDLDRIVNILATRLRETVRPFIPEVEKRVPDHGAFAELVATNPPSAINNQEGVTASMGASIQEDDWQEIQRTGDEVTRLVQLREAKTEYLERVMKDIMPNTLALTGPTVGARLVEQAGSLKELSLFPASTIQILGAEKALFRHLRSGAKAPKHGILYQHQLVQQAKNKGRAARLLADKIAIASRVDHFEGEYVGDTLLKQVEAKL